MNLKNIDKRVLLGLLPIIIIVGGIVFILAFTGSDEADTPAEIVENIEYGELPLSRENQQLSQEAAKALADTDTSGFSEEELFDYYLTLAETLVASDDYESAASIYSLAGEASPSQYSVYVSKAEALILAQDADGAKAAYAEALEAFKASGAEGADQYEEYIQYQIDNAEAALEYGPIYDGRSLDDELVEVPEEQ